MKLPAKCLIAVFTLLILVSVAPNCQANSKGKFPGIGSKDAWKQAVQFYNQAVEKDGTKSWKEAAALYQKAVDAYPKDAVFHAGLGASLMEIPKPAEAERALLEATRLEPDFQQPWFNLGIVYYNTKKPAQAKKAFEKALTLTKTEPEKKEINDYLSKVSKSK